MGLSRRNFLELAAGGAAASLASAAEKPAGGQASEARPPNILLMLGDDHRWDALGARGNPTVRTPHLDRLAQEGILFENNFTTNPICCASRASIMTGQYAATTGIYDFVTPLTPDQVKQAYYGQLKQAGYHIGFIGKFGVGRTMPSEEFDYWRGFPGQGNYWPNGTSGRHLTHIIRDQANEFFQSSPKDRPFCLSISFKSPHVQDQAPEQYLPTPESLALFKDITIPPISRAGTDDIRRFPLSLQHTESLHRWGVRFATPERYQASVKGYYGLINGIDTAIASMRATLDRLGLADNTIIIYSADHGIFLGEHGMAGKWYAYEECIRTPLIIYDPRPSARHHGERRRAMTLNIDLNPTIVELANLQPTAATQGRSIVPQLREDNPNARRILYVEHDFPDRGWIPSSQSIRTQRWKYIHWTDSAAPYEELYDLENDEFETHNLIGQSAYAHQQRILTGYWKTWRDSLKKGMSSWTQPVTEADMRRDGIL